MDRDFVWVFVRPDNPYNFAMLPPTPAAEDLKPLYQTITKWIWQILLNGLVNSKRNSGY